MLKLVRVALDYLYVVETSRFEITGHLCSLKQAKIDRDFLSIPLVAMEFSFAAVERQEQFPVRSYHATHLLKRPRHGFSLEVDCGIENDYRRQRFVRKIER